MKRIKVIRGDITTLEVDAIVNAANNALCGGGGVDGAIHRAAGPRLPAACRSLGGCETGAAKLTPGFDLPAKFIIHTVGPVWRGGGHRERELLRSCHRVSLELAAANNARSVAFPAISCGVFGFPVEAAAKVAMAEVSSFLEQSDAVDSVFFVCFEDSVFEAFRRQHEALDSNA